MPGFFVPQLTIGDVSIVISGEEFHHIIHVFRKKIGEEILLTNGKGILSKATIASFRKKELTANILEIQEEKTSQPEITVAFPLLKNKHDALIVEKLTELGVKEFFPIITERTVRQPSKNTLDKFTKIAVSAIKQCDNAFLPKIHEFSTLRVLFGKLQKMYKQPLAALETGEHRLLTNVVQEFNGKELCLIFGPEGGFSPAEINLLHQEKIPTFTLGNHILRAETAAITAVSQLLGFYLKQDPNYY